MEDILEEIPDGPFGVFVFLIIIMVTGIFILAVVLSICGLFTGTGEFRWGGYGSGGSDGDDDGDGDGGDWD
ncbi:hypothetical protein [Streptosporangium carneum]|uniref:Uncharacterized protein n=1 Tax=Streptosporangium carneum TaxID=47481 RepID=A0A9W6MF31_9ACTN|nr:hypothetical protein [Streptosporangium carneum]GLK12219.1 hypothetical protein GCM10017600_56280 [Streptosporangium carneum]